MNRYLPIHYSWRGDANFKNGRYERVSSLKAWWRFGLKMAISDIRQAVRNYRSATPLRAK